MNAIRIAEFGGPEVLHYESVPDPAAKAGEVVVKIEAVGVNFIDVYHRKGMYKIALPQILGQEAAGTVTAVGPETTAVKAGDRVAWTSVFGGYAEYCAVPTERLVVLPPEITSRRGAAAMRRA